MNNGVGEIISDCGEVITDFNLEEIVGIYSIYDLLTSLDADDRKLILDLVKPKASAKRRKQRAKVKSGRKPKFRQTKKEILKSVGRKTGGKVSRPKGVGCAVKGYGKAMTRG